MRVRCSFCGAEYEAAITAAALDLVDRCAQCGRAQLRAVDPAEPGDEPPRRPSAAPDAPTDARAG
jgi:predicted  nucleic acid-binding Zn-ribbon protein